MNLIVESKRDQRILDWLISQVGVDAVADACKQLPGSRRAYVSNVAKMLKLCPPSELALTSKEDAQHHLEAISRILKVQQQKGKDDGSA